MSNEFPKEFISGIILLGDEMENDELRELILENQNLIYSIIHKFRSKDYDDLFRRLENYTNYYYHNHSLNYLYSSY